MRITDVIEQRARTARTVEEAAQVLSDLLSSDFAVWFDERLYHTRQEVEKVDGLRIEVHSHHPEPPLFVVAGPGFDAAFAVDDCALARGGIGDRHRALVEWWFKRTRPLLVATSNRSRAEPIPE